MWQVKRPILSPLLRLPRLSYNFCYAMNLDLQKAWPPFALDSPGAHACFKALFQSIPLAHCSRPQEGQATGSHDVLTHDAPHCRHGSIDRGSRPRPALPKICLRSSSSSQTHKTSRHCDPQGLRNLLTAAGWCHPDAAFDVAWHSASYLWPSPFGRMHEEHFRNTALRSLVLALRSEGWASQTQSATSITNPFKSALGEL